MTSSSYFIRGARQLLTLRGPQSARRGAALRELAIIADGSVLIQNGRIMSVGPTRRIENMREARQAVEIPVYDKVVMPGFVDAAVQLSPAGAAAGPAKRMMEFSNDVLLLMRSCLQHGTVTIRVHASADRPVTSADVSVRQKLVRLGDEQMQVLRSWRVEACVPEDAWPTLVKLRRRRMVDGISIASQPESEPDWERLEHLRSSGLAMYVLWGGGPAERLSKMLQRMQPVSICALEPLSSRQADLLASTDVITVLPAGKQILEGNAFPSIRKLMDGGGAIALSSGYHSGIARNFNLQMALALAVARMGLTPEEAISAATFNAACAANYAHTAGSIEVGKRADVMVLNIPDFRDLPAQFGVNHVAMVFRAGEIVFNRMRRRDSADPSSDRMRTKSV